MDDSLPSVFDGEEWAFLNPEKAYGHLGKTIDEILANEGSEEEEDLLDAAIYRIFSKEETLGPSSLTEVETRIIAVRGFQGEVHNGGFDQYFWNSASDLAAYALAGLHEIGAKKAHKILKKAMAVFPSSEVPVVWVERQELVEKIEEKADPIWEKLENKFYASKEPVDKLLFEYIKKNKDGIVL